MSRACEICGKRTQRGNRLAKRGKAKHLGGVGTKITGKVKRTFKPNLQRVRAEIDGTRTRIKVCTRCLKRGRAPKPTIKSKPITAG